MLCYFWLYYLRQLKVHFLSGCFGKLLLHAQCCHLYLIRQIKK